MESMRWSGHHARTLAAMGEYEAAQQMLDASRQSRKASLKADNTFLEEAFSAQWSAFQRAKTQVTEDLRREADQREATKTHELRDFRLRHVKGARDDLARYKALEKDRTSRRVLPVPQSILMAQQEEAKFALDGRYMEAERMRQLATHLNALETHRVIEWRKGLVESRVAKRAALLRRRDTVAFERRAVEMELDRIGVGQQALNVEHRLQHMEGDMLAAQNRQKRLLAHVRHRPDESYSDDAKVRRGALLERRVYGSAYRLPSLCAEYGPYLGEQYPMSPL